jgi:hypothetical protein
MIQNEEERRVSLTIRIPIWLKDVLEWKRETTNKSVGKQIEDALVTKYGPYRKLRK